ncbi:hypothetical protein M427DRAFT_62003, partial [Gonapodya prolifera JEL478]
RVLVTISYRWSPAPPIPPIPPVPPTYGPMVGPGGGPRSIQGPDCGLPSGIAASGARRSS